MGSISFGDKVNSASLDLVCAWYIKSANMMLKNPAISTALVSTNSVTQGEQAATLWPVLLERKVSINYAHRTFQWSSEARGKAAVHCVIIGFGCTLSSQKTIYDYESITSDPHAISAKNINPYLVDAPTVILENRRQPICHVSPMLYGSKPADGGHLLLSETEKNNLQQLEPSAAEFIKKFLNAEEFLHNTPRYCLWLVDCPPNRIKQMPLVRERIENVRRMRADSKKAATRELALTPTIFAEIRQTKTRYLLVPRHSSENRIYIPVGYFDAEVICGDANFQIPEATLYDFGVFTSLMHMSWMRTVCGRIKSDYRYSNTIVYNNFPWPENSTEKQKIEIEKWSQAVLDARLQFPDASLADLYNPLTMPPVLLKTHQSLDKAVDAAYGKTNFKSEAERVAYLFELYQKCTSLLPVDTSNPKRKGSKSPANQSPK